MFKKYYRENKYKKEDKISRLIFKCIYHRKDEKIRIELKKPYFCNETIEYVLPDQNVKGGYFFKSNHSEECKNLYKINSEIIETKDNQKIIQINKNL